jgi:hypothetical protein
MTVAEVLLAYDPDQVKPGWIAFFLVLVLVVVTFLLWRSMNTQLGRIKVPPAQTFRNRGVGGTSPGGADAPAGDDEDDGPRV